MGLYCLLQGHWTTLRFAAIRLLTIPIENPPNFLSIRIILVSRSLRRKGEERRREEGKRVKRREEWRGGDNLDLRKSVGVEG